MPGLKKQSHKEGKVTNSDGKGKSKKEKKDRSNSIIPSNDAIIEVENNNNSFSSRLRGTSSRSVGAVEGKLIQNTSLHPPDSYVPYSRQVSAPASHGTAPSSNNSNTSLRVTGSFKGHKLGATEIGSQNPSTPTFFLPSSSGSANSSQVSGQSQEFPHSRSVNCLELSSSGSNGPNLHHSHTSSDFTQSGTHSASHSSSSQVVSSSGSSCSKSSSGDTNFSLHTGGDSGGGTSSSSTLKNSSSRDESLDSSKNGPVSRANVDSDTTDSKSNGGVQDTSFGDLKNIEEEGLTDGLSPGGVGKTTPGEEDRVADDEVNALSVSGEDETGGRWDLHSYWIEQIHFFIIFFILFFLYIFIYILDYPWPVGSN